MRRRAGGPGLVMGEAGAGHRGSPWGREPLSTAGTRDLFKEPAECEAQVWTGWVSGASQARSAGRDQEAVGKVSRSLRPESCQACTLPECPVCPKGKVQELRGEAFDAHGAGLTFLQQHLKAPWRGAGPGSAGAGAREALGDTPGPCRWPRPPHVSLFSRGHIVSAPQENMLALRW